jgi:hypothetical protein
MMTSVEDEYAPTVPPDVAERIRQWHEDAYERGRVDGPQTFDYLGLTLVVPPDVPKDTSSRPRGVRCPRAPRKNVVIAR